MTPNANTPLSPASAALLAAVDQAITGDTPYPDRAAFVHADQPDAGHQIARAAADGRAVVLCSADGTRQVLYPRAPAAAYRDAFVDGKAQLCSLALPESG